MTSLFVTWNVSPYIFEIGSFQLRWYSVLYALAFYTAYQILKRIFKKEGLDNNYLDQLFIYVFLGVVIGARFGHCLFYEPEHYLLRPWEILLPFDTTTWKITGFSGLSSHGGAIGILTAIVLYCRKTKVYYMWILDRLVITIALAGLFIRLGNLMNSEIYGHVTNLPWGFIFSRNGEHLPKHPTQIYEALTYLSISIILFYIYIKKQRKPKAGMLFSLFLILVFGARFGLEFIKENQESFEDSMFLNMGQILSIPFILLGSIFLYYSLRGKFKNILFTKVPKKK